MLLFLSYKQSLILLLKKTSAVQRVNECMIEEVCECSHTSRAADNGESIIAFEARRIYRTQRVVCFWAKD